MTEEVLIKGDATFDDLKHLLVIDLVNLGGPCVNPHHRIAL